MKDEIDDVLDKATPMDEKTYVGGPAVPLTYEPEWNDYVMKQFTEDEKFEGHPTVDGMRRVTEKLIGEIVGIETSVPQTPDNNNNNRATVIVRVVIAAIGGEQIYSGAADVCWMNTDKPYYKHPVSTAETRAEGRALKRALKLRKVVCAEEMVKDKSIYDQETFDEENGKITEQQIKFIDIICSRNNFNAKALLESQNLKLEDMTHTQAANLQQKLSEYQQNKDAVPAEVVGYKQDWRK